LKETVGALKSGERQKVKKVEINGVEYQQRRRNEESPNSWLRLDGDKASETSEPVTQRWIQRRWKKQKKINHPIIVRFPRLKQPAAKPFGENPTWENIPRFDPDEVDDTRWLIPSLLAEKGINLLYGSHGSCKTTLMMYAAKCISEGSDFLGLKTLRRHFLVFDYGNPTDFLKLRAIDLDLQLPENPRLIIWNRLKESVPLPSNSKIKDFVRRHVKKYGVGPILMFDSWADLLKPGEGGETTGQIAPIYAAFRKLVDLGATVIVIDHTRKGDDELYGGAHKFANSDSSHKFTGPDKNGAVTVESTLKRYSPESPDTFSFKVHGYKDEKGNWRIKRVQAMRDAAKEERIAKIQYLRRLIKEKGEDGKEALLDKAVQEGHSRAEISRILESEKKSWEMHRGKSGKHTYRLRDHEDV
jgi:AAA domain